MAVDNTNYGEMLMQQIAAGQQAMANRPQKTFQRTTTAPLELADMRMRRDTIGSARNALANSLMNREQDMGYALGNALANYGGQSMPGQIDWASGLRSLGGGLTAPTNFNIDRAQRDYDASRADLSDALNFDKSMGQVQDEMIGYTGGTGGSGTGGGVGAISPDNFGRSTGYDPVANKLNFGPIARAAATGEQAGFGDWLTIPGSNALAKGLQPTKSADLQTIYSDVADNILSGKVLDFIGKAGSVRVADTEDEKRMLFGPLVNYQNMSDTQLNNAISQARNNYVAVGMKKARNAGVPVTENELKTYFNSAFTVPSGIKKTMPIAQNIQDTNQGSIDPRIQQALNAGYSQAEIDEYISRQGQ